MTEKDGGQALTCSKCGCDFAGKKWNIKSRDYRCPECKRAQQNALNHSRPELMRNKARGRYARARGYWLEYEVKRRQDPQYLLMRKARRKVGIEIDAGRLVRGLCERCGKANTDAHHDDYSNPLEIRWLCHSCHILMEKEKTRERKTRIAC